MGQIVIYYHVEFVDTIGREFNWTRKDSGI